MMAKKAPGRAERRGITLLEITERFSTDEKAEAWFIGQRWPDCVACPARLR